MSKFSAKLTQAGFSFNLVADNNEIIATSQVYTSKGACLKGIESVQANAPYASVEDQTVADFERLESPKFEVFTDKADKFRFRLKAANGEIIAASQGYKAKASCLKGIESVQANAPWADIVVSTPLTRTIPGPRPLRSSAGTSSTSATRRASRSSSERTPRSSAMRAASSSPVCPMVIVTAPSAARWSFSRQIC